MKNGEDRRRTVLYSNVKKNKKADKKSASEDKSVINLDNEIIIGITRLPEQNKNSKSGQVVNNSKKGAQENISNKEKIRIQKRRIIKKLTGIIILLLFLVSGLIYFLLSPVFNIKNINVINNEILSSDVIINLSGITIDQNIFKMSKKEAKGKLLSNPYIEGVEIKRKNFNIVEINVKERYATLMLEYGNSYVYINNQGYILEISTNKIEVPILTGYVTPLDQIKPGNRLSKDDLERLKVVLNIMESASSNQLNNLITKIDIKSKKNYILTLEGEEKKVYLGECLDLSTQMLFIKEMVEREKGIEGDFFVDMDLNTANPVFREKV